MPKTRSSNKVRAKAKHPRLPVKIKEEKNDSEALKQLNKQPKAQKNVKTEVKVENKRLSGENKLQQTMSPLVHAADGRSRHNVIDGNRPFRIPPHLLGRNLSDPTADVVAGSRRPLQKPRLGVKIPYRNLTSQIVTHEELTRELLERSKRNNPSFESIAAGASEGSRGYFFTMKLMARLAHRLPNPHLPETSLRNIEEPSVVDGLGFMRPGCSIDPELEREIALKQLQELPTKRKTRDLVTEHIDYKRIAIKAEPLTPRQLALKQLEEIQIRKPRAEYIQTEILSKKRTRRKFKSKLKLQVKVNAAKPKTRDFIKKEAINQVSHEPKSPKDVGKPKVQSRNSEKARVSPRKREVPEMAKTRMSSRLAR